jgi:hypothetical protein
MTFVMAHAAEKLDPQPVRDPFSPEGLALIQERLGITAEEFLAGVAEAEALHERLPADVRAELDEWGREIAERHRMHGR